MGQLGVLASGLAGAAGGSLIPGVGGSIGWIVGSIIGNLLFPDNAPDNVGPRLGDLSVTSSAFGLPIPLGFGTIRQAGNLIWTAGIEEQEKKQKAPGGLGSGGGGPSNVTFAYFSTFALSFGEGPAKAVLRLWADGKLIYDRTGLQDEVNKKGLQFRLYPGNETQLPDSLIEADVGVGNTPAYRGQIYVVFQRLPLADFGNRIPNITAEIARELITVFPVTEATTLDDPLTDFSQNEFAVDWKRGFAFALDTTGDETTTGIRRFNIHNMREDRQLPSVDALDQVTQGPSTIRGPLVTTPGGILVASAAVPVDTNSRPIVALDVNSMREIGRFGVSNSALTFQRLSAATITDMATISFIGPLGLEEYVIVQSQFSSFAVFFVSLGVALVWSSDMFRTTLNSTKMESVCGGKSEKGQGTGYAISGADYGIGASSESLRIWRVRLQAGAIYTFLNMENVTVGTDVVDKFDLTPGDIIAGETSLKDGGHGAVYDEIDDTIIFHVKADSDNQNYLVKADVNNTTIKWTTKIPVGPSDGSTWSQSNLIENTFGFLSASGTAYVVDTRTGELIVDGDTFSVFGGSGQLGAFNGGSDVWLGLSNTSGRLAKWFFNRKDGGPAVISDILTTISGKVDLTASDIDVTDLTDNSIPGYVVARQTSARKAIQPLASAFFFDGVETDYKLAFKERGSSPIRTIVQDDLGVVDKKQDLYLKETRIQEQELPARFTITYMERDNNYQQGTQSSKRLQNPTSSMSSSNQLGLTIPGVLTSDVAKQMAEKKLFTSWLERVSLQTIFSWKNLDLDPTDVVSILLDDGTNFRVRLVKNDLGVNLQIAATGIQEEVGQYLSSVLADKGTGPVVQSVPSTFATRLLLLDVPLLRDSDEPANRAFLREYYLMGGYGQGAWTSASLFKSTDGEAFDQIGRSVDEMTWGTTVGALGDPPNSNPFVTDDTNSLTVSMATSDDPIASVTQLQMLSGANPMAILKDNGEIEVIQFRDAVDNGDGTFTLSGLLRGRRGTDTMAFSHKAGETAVLLNSMDASLFPLSLSEKDAERFYRGVGTGQLLEESDLVSQTSLGRALMPYAPTLIKAAQNVSDVDITWIRRTRVGGPLNNFAGTVPLNEDTEEYEIDIFDAPGGTIVRTATGLTAELYKYLQADIQSDLSLIANTPLTITNPGGETGDLTGWTSTTGFGIRTSSPAPRTGSNYFFGGNSGTDSDMFQDLAVPSGLFGDVDSGNATAKLDWWQSAFGSNNDPGGASIEFFDSGMLSLGSTASTVITTAGQVWTARALSGAMPVNTRTIRIKMIGHQLSTPNIDSFFDDIAASIDVGLVVPQTLTLKVYQISAQVGRGFAREVTVDVT